MLLSSISDLLVCLMIMRFTELLDVSADVPEAAGSLWIAKIARALTRLDASGNVGHHAGRSHRTCRMELAHCMPEAVADTYLVTLRLLLIDPLPDIGRRICWTDI